MTKKLPGVYTKEIDNSSTPEESTGSTGLFVGLARKGMINSPVYISSEKQLIDTFGKPLSTDSDYAMLGALDYVDVSPLYFTRVATADMRYGKIGLDNTVKMASANIDIVPKAVVGTISITGSDGVKEVVQEVAGINSADAIITTGGIYAPKANSTNSPELIEDAEKELSENNSVILFSSIGPSTESDLVGVTIENFETFTVSGEASSVSMTYRYDVFQDRLGDSVQTYYSANPAPVGSASALAEMKAYKYVATVRTGQDINKYISKQNFYKSSTLISVDESSFTVVDNGTESTVATGTTFTFWSNASAVASVSAVFDNVTVAKAESNSVHITKDFWYAGFGKISGTGKLMSFVNRNINGVETPVCPWFRNYDYSPSAVTTNMTKIGQAGNIWQSVFKVSVFTRASSLDNFSTEPAEVFYGTIGDVSTEDGTNLNIKNAINGISRYVYVATSESIDGNVIVPKAVFSAVNAKLTYNNDITSPSGYFGISFRPVSLGKGESGSDGLVGDYQSAYNLYTNKRDIQIDIIAETKPTASHAIMVDSLISSRLDCRGTIQIGDSTTTSVNSIVNNYTSINNTSYISKYAGWYKRFDNYNKKYRWLPMSIMGAYLQAKCMAQFKASAAPAGIRRGIIPVEAMYKKYSDSEILQMTNKRINTAMWQSGVGYVMWGEDTAYTITGSALGSIQVRATLLKIERECENLLNSYLFEGNTSSERLRVSSNITSILSGEKGNGNINNFSVRCDDSNNSDDSEEMNVSIAVVPIRTTKVINLTVVITKSSVSIEEAV